MIYNCCNQERKAAILGNPTLNGIDYLEVLDQAAIPLNSPRQQTLLVHCLKPVPTNLVPGNILITGGESITGIVAQWVAPASTPPPSPQTNQKERDYFTSLPDAAKIIVVRTSKAGDFSPYVLRLVNNASQAAEDPFQITEVLSGFDPELSQIQFSFKVECGPNFDCKPQPPNCSPNLPAPPPINYLAKDYGSFRTIMLDRLNQLIPSWGGGGTEADLGVALAEVIAYVGDYLSYQQDAVSTEAYLETARSRISLRRHALLVDYHVHDGSNARAWVHLQVSSPVFLDHSLTRFYTFAPGMPSSLAVGSGNEEAALLAGVIVFEPMQNANLFPEHNQMNFYTWGDNNCCLPQGATEATLLGVFPNLQPGDVLIFQEVMGPQTGNPADADMRHRCAVRLTQVTTQNGAGQPLVDPLFEAGTGKPIVSSSQLPTPVTEIQWSSADALPFPVCISSTFVDSTGNQQTVVNVSIVLGNIVLADQGLSFSGINLGTVPQPTLFLPPDPSANRCQPSAPVPLAMRYRPLIPDSPITQAVPLPLAGSPVTSGIVHLQSSGFVSLSDVNGFTSLMLQAAKPFTWPQFFGLAADAKAAPPGTFNLSLIYNPPGGAIGVPSPVILESFRGLSLKPADPNYVVKQINSLSKFISVPSSYSPPASGPNLPHNPADPPIITMLLQSGAVNLQDLSANTYLVVQPTNPLGWPPSFGVIAQGNQQNPDIFNLLVIYDPPSGGVGVQTPIVVEQFNGVSLATVSGLFTSNSELVSVKSFEQEPNPSLSAFDLMNYDASQALPVITLSGTHNNVTTQWTPEPDLLESGPADTNFAVEIEANQTAHLLFGDNTNGLRPESGTFFTAAYRIGNGIAGNVGAESLVFLAAADARIQSCTNPLPAFGGVDPETMDQIRRRAPQAFLTQQRAITMPDYEAVVDSNSQVQESVATLRWTGSWYTVFITAQPKTGGSLPPVLESALDQNVERYRLAGQDLQFESPQYVPLQIELAVCVDPDYFQSDVQQSLLQVLGSQMLPNGQRGLFFPGNFTFGQTVYLSPIYAAARTVPGVLSVTATVFQPQGVNSSIYLNNGEIPLGPFQVALMQNDPSFPNHGQLTLVMQGGK
ncbi:MAG TPA: putative baseplate assembly protein [Candidatus Angelobacter sp.]